MTFIRLIYNECLIYIITLVEFGLIYNECPI